MKIMKQLFIQKMFEVHKYLCELDKQNIEKIEKDIEKMKDKDKKEIINEYIKFRRKNQ